MSEKNTYFITTAIDYVNNLPHIGTAYEKIAADVIARFKRLEGESVIFLMGNDEHSINVKKEAHAQGLQPQDYCDGMAARFRDIWQRLGISYDAFIRTTDAHHARTVTTLFQKIYDNGDIYPSKYRGLYCDSCETFYMEKDLEEGKCPQHGTPPRWIEEDNYFFALSRYQDRVIQCIREGTIKIRPEIRTNEILNVLEGGLEDISISRSSFDWGIPLPIQPNHVVYVWFDALINYISAIGYGWDMDRFAQCWPADLHVIGKDITRFHCIIWPAMLMSAGLEVPRMIFGHGFVYLKGEKMSKSLGNVVSPMDIIDEYGPDALRYYLLRDTSFGKDGNFTWDNFIERYNRDLANDLGNLLQRLLTMIHRYRSGTLPSQDQLNQEDESLKSRCTGLLAEVRAHLDPQEGGDIDFHLALAGIWEVVRQTNQYIDHQAPWELAKQGQDTRLDTVLYCAAECMRVVAGVLSPFLPQAAGRMVEQLGLEPLETISSPESLSSWGLLPPGTAVRKPEAVFPRILVQGDPEKKQKPPQKARQKKPEKKREAEKAGVLSIEDFSRVKLLVGKVLEAERVPDTDKLIKLSVDTGGVRTVVAGIGKRFAPEELIGQTVVVVANLKPVKLRGILSEGMVLAAGDKEVLGLVTVTGDIQPGERIK